MASEFKKNGTAKKIGRLNYFEPNITIGKGNESGTNSDLIPYPYEDYCMAVDLRITVYDRYSCGFSKSNGMCKKYDFSTENGTLSFFGGTSVYGNGNEYKYLTTNYTDISMKNPNGNTSECLGIESISITYENWFFPNVNIKFVDVRGATVMQPAESGYYNEDKRAKTYQIYKAFFSFPYPLFELTVKGFYGKGVTYRLVIEKTNIEFDSTNGNFIINADFIGHIFGFFADIPISYLAVAPYTSVGSKYWDDMVENGNFWFLDSAGEKKCAMMRIPDLNILIAKSITSFESRAADSENAVKINTCDNKMRELEVIIDLYKSFATDEGFYEYENSETCYLINIDRSKSEGKSNFSDFLKQFCDNLKSYCDKYSKNYYSRFGKISEFDKNIDDRVICFKYNKTGNKNFDTLEKDKNEKISIDILEKNKDGVLDYMSDKAQNFRSGEILIYLYYFDKGTTDKYSDIIKEIEKEKSYAEDEKVKTEEGFKKEKNIMIENAIGFSPTIRNMYNYMFAHLDTFMEVYYSVLKKISGQLNPSLNERKKINYDIDEENILTDTQKTKSNDFRGDFLPPFAAYYKNDANGNSAIIWPGTLKNGETNLEEVKLVDEILNASRMFAVKNDESKKLMEEYQASLENKSYDTLSDLTTSSFSFIPLTSFDFANNKIGGVNNPYNSLVNALKSGDGSIAGDIMFRFSLRYFYYHNMCNGNIGFNYNDNGWYKFPDAKTFGRLEALNLFKAFGENDSLEFINFIKEYANGDAEAKANEFIKYITSTTNTNPKITGAWFCEGNSNGMKNIFESDGKGVLKYVYLPKNNDLRYIPLNDFDINKIKKDVANGSFDKNYISTINYDKFEGNTFFIYEDRDYIKTLFENIKSEIEESSKKAKEISEKRYGDWSADQYGGLIEESTTVNAYKNNIGHKDKEEELYYFKESIVNSKGSSKKSELKKLMFGSKSEQDEYYIKRPTEINDTTDSSLFNHPIYLIQDNILAKAYLFLQALPIVGRNCSIDNVSFNGITPKSVLLREGAFYWYKDNSSIVKTEGECEKPLYKFIGKDNETLRVEKMKYSCESPIDDGKYTFISNYSEKFFVSIFDGYGMETINPVPIGAKDKYFDINFPKGKSKSREINLKQMFIDWAEKEYGDIEPLLCDIDYYGIEVETKTYGNNNDGSPKIIINQSRKYEKGLDISYFDSETKYDYDKVSNARKIQDFLHKLFFTVDTTFDYYNGFYNNNEMVCNVETMKTAFKSFVEQLHSIYGDSAKEASEDLTNFLAKSAINLTTNPFKSEDLKLSTYMTLKSLYDKWICASFNGENTWRFRGKKEGVNDVDTIGNGEYELDRFMYVDNFFHDIGDRLKVSLTKITEWLDDCVTASSTEGEETKMYLNNHTLYEYLADVAVGCGGILLAIPQRYIFSKNFPIDEAFRPYPYSSNWYSDDTTYLFKYSYKPSEHLGDYDTGSMDMNGYSPNGDGIDMNDNEIVGKVFGTNVDGYSVPAFGVTFAKQNQSYFKNISLKTQTNGVTEVSIMNTMSIASKASQGPHKTVLYGQDIYKIYSNYSYECTVEMMGDMQIFPLMYFQLNNVPMWKGGYLIEKVSHEITAGNITTKFTGVRQNRYAIPMADAELCAPLNEKNGTEAGGTSYGRSAEDYSALNYTPDYNSGKPLKTFSDVSLVEKEKTNIGLVSYCKAQVGKYYWFGAYGQIATKELEDSLRKGKYTKQFWNNSCYDNSTLAYGSKVHDCSGLVCGYFYSDGVDKPAVINQKVFPRYNAEGIFKHSKVKGLDPNTIPDVPGVLVFRLDKKHTHREHVGVYIGNKTVIEANGCKRGVIEHAYIAKNWNGGWAYLDELYYYDENTPN